MTAGVGADIEALCAKCGDVWHVVVAKEGDKIAKVQCKQCGGYHRYKSVAGASAEQKNPSRFGDKPEKPAKATKSTAKAPVERFEKPSVAADLTKPVRTYRASEKFDVGERIDHPTFGQGVVEVYDAGKITVFFSTGRRVLVAAKSSDNALSRPKPFDYSNAAGGKRVTET